MRILFVTDLSLRTFGNRANSFERKILYGLLRNNHHVIEFSDKDIGRYTSPFKFRPLVQQYANRHLLTTARNFQPELVVISQSGLISNATLAEIKQRHGALIACFTCDALFIADNRERQQSRAAVADALFATTAGAALQALAQPGVCAAYLPNVTEPSIDYLQNHTSAALDIDLLFCGSSEPQEPRFHLIGQLRRELADIRFQVHGLHGQPKLQGGAYYQTLARTRMALNINRQEDYLYSSDRLMQIMGNGILAFIDASSGLQRFFSEREAVFFHDYADLLDRIRYFARHEPARAAVAAAGWRLAHQEFSAQRAAQFMVETTARLPYSHDYLWQDDVYTVGPATAAPPAAVADTAQTALKHRKN